MARIQTSSSDDLPKHFISAMRTLFDIMDDQRTGFVKFSDIEGRWQDDGTQGLPKGVLESLKKVTPANGMLSFERFCAGLKICLLHIRVENDAKNQDSQPKRPPSAPTLATEEQTKAAWTSPNTAAIRPNNVISQQRTLSMPQLLPGRKEGNPQLENVDPKNYLEPKMPKAYGPPKPSRPSAIVDGRTLNPERNFDKSEIRTVLQNWQMGLLMGDDKALDKRQVPNKYRTDSRTVLRPARHLGDGNVVELQNSQVDLQAKKSLGRRREPRRHTLQNGIDYNMMKRMKQIEQEKDVLIQGLAAVDRTREWYLKQISISQEKIKHLGRMGSHVEQWTEAQQERLELQRARVLEVNRHLAALISTWERGGLPLHMNLAFLSTPSNAQQNQDMFSRLKQQNHKLNEEVSKKSQRIALLEQEKDNLMRELYNRQSGMVQSRRSTMIHEQHDQTFM
ncbi:suppressor APC domain-containing protein 2 isoform X2 [Belonocnema kinseyi]|uniref:suppressor APC domain-containing protein 2 isoform X2 n=1 Tax=Belonocnema kinseyi TaxID=2817044 RepID=UPI00143D0B2C|nr:suppressor APC domain-containing protein 2 isoform X2 [Belonocnema kinseyi]